MITVIVSKATIMNEPKITENVSAFIAEMKPYMRKCKPSQVFNIDQSNFNKEMYSRTTLTYIGTKKVNRRNQSVTAATHAYTIQQLISAYGTLHSPKLIVLQEEKDGTFSPYVEQKMKKINKPKKLFIRCSNSGLVSKKIIEECFINIYFKTAQDKGLLI